MKRPTYSGALKAEVDQPARSRKRHHL